MAAKAAILIDGGYFLKRLPQVRRDVDSRDVSSVVKSIDQLVRGHLLQLNEVLQVPDPRSLLYRCFYYDATPYANKGEQPVSRRPLDYARSEMAEFRKGLFAALMRRPSFALRLGEVRKAGGSSWVMKPDVQKRLLNGSLQIADLEDADFVPDLHQKGVDMRVGLDIATISLKQQADTIILVSGDSDFVPAAKLARREGVTFVLDPLWQNVSDDLLEHVDGLRSGFFRPKPDRSAANGVDSPAHPV